MSAQENVERVGAVVVRRTPIGDGAYREQRAARIEITAGDGRFPLQRALPVFLLVIALGALLFGFAFQTRTYPAMGTVGAALSALVALLVFSRRRMRRTTFEIAERRFTARPPSGTVITGELTAIDDSGAGVDLGSRRTVWIKMGGERRLVFEGLSDPEVQLVRRVLDEAVDAARASARAGRAVVAQP